MNGLLRIPSPDLRDGARLLDGTFAALRSGKHAVDRTGADSCGEDLRVLKNLDLHPLAPAGDPS